MRPLRLVLPLLALLGALAPAAAAAPPPNDTPATAAPFNVFGARAAPPGEREAVADLTEATAEQTITPCLGATSFSRTVWFRVDATGGARELTVEATGRTLDPIDLAAFVQPGPSGPPVTTFANACGGKGADGADAAEDRTSAVALRVPPNRAVLIQVGRRGTRGAPFDEQVQLSLSAVAVPPTAPEGDRAGSATPRVPRRGVDTVGLSGATTTEEDVATPRCQALATVWRQVRLRRRGRHLLSVEGGHAGTLAVFGGSRPKRTTFLDCVDREGLGPLTLPVRGHPGRRLWVRVGTDRPPIGGRARLRVRKAVKGDRSSGGGCLGEPGSRIGGGLASGPAQVKPRNKLRFVGLALRVEDGPVCAARLRLVGPRNRLFAVADVAAVRGGGQVVLLRRTRRLRRGRYRLEVEAAGYAGVRYDVPTRLSFRLF